MKISIIENNCMNKARLIHFIKCIYKIIKPIRGRNNIIKKSEGVNYCYYFIKGDNNYIEYGKNVNIGKLFVKILGNNNKLIIEDNVKIVNKDSDYFLLDGDNCEIRIGNNTSIQSAHINAQEDNSKIIIGQNCMLSDGIVIRTSDSHPIYDRTTSERLNPPASITIGDNVWIAQKSTIMKGVKIGNGAIIG